MGTMGKGCLIIGLIGLAAIAFFVYYVGSHPPPPKSAYTSSIVTNYLDLPPEFLNPRTLATGSPAPDFTYASIGNQVVRLSDYIGQKYVILDFWATWCPPCRMELPALQEFYARRGNEVEIIAITSEDSNAKMSIRQMVTTELLRFQILHDPTDTIGSAYPHEAIPFLVFIDKDGIVRGTHLGYSENVDGAVAEMFGI
jgi:peroxiredoxin